MKDPVTGSPELGIPIVAIPPVSPDRLDRFSPDGNMSLKLLIKALTMLETPVPLLCADTTVPEAGARIVAA
jgi:hypothetical protein